jgi:hypothetical protein
MRQIPRLVIMATNLLPVSCSGHASTHRRLYYDMSEASKKGTVEEFWSDRAEALRQLVIDGD